MKKYTKTEKKSEKINKQYDLSADTIDNFSELAEIFKQEIFPMVEKNLKIAISIDGIKKLEARLSELGKAHKADSLLTISEKLHDLSDSFDFEGIRASLTELCEMSQSVFKLKKEIDC